MERNEDGVERANMSNTPELSRIIWGTQRSDSQEVRSREVFTEGVNFGGSTPSDTDGHDPSLFVSIPLSGGPIARYLEKRIEVFTEGVKCWRIDSVGHGRTRPVSLCVGSTEQSPIARDFAELLHRTQTVFSGV